MQLYAHITSSSLGTDINSLSAPHTVPFSLLYKNKSVSNIDSSSTLTSFAIVFIKEPFDELSP